MSIGTTCCLCNCCPPWHRVGTCCCLCCIGALAKSTLFSWSHRIKSNRVYSHVQTLSKLRVMAPSHTSRSSAKKEQRRKTCAHNRCGRPSVHGPKQKWYNHLSSATKENIQHNTKTPKDAKDKSRKVTELKSVPMPPSVLLYCKVPETPGLFHQFTIPSSLKHLLPSHLPLLVQVDYTL